MQALILAGGEGTRLRPLTSTVPKPVLPLAGRPFLTFMIDWLAGHGVDQVILSCGFLSDQVEQVLGGRYGGVDLTYVHEDEPLGTAGPVKLAEAGGLLQDRFLVLNGDVLTDMDVTAQIARHEETGARATLALVPVDDTSSYGVVPTNPDGSVVAFLEKTKGEVPTNLINAGCYVMESDVLSLIPEGAPCSFERDVFPALVGDGLYGHASDGYWMDIGTPERYLQATWDLLAGTVSSNLPPSDESGSLIYDPSITSGARIGPQAVVGPHCSVGAGAVIDRAVLQAGVIVGADARIVESILGEGVIVGEGARIDRGAVLGAGAEVPPAGHVPAGERVDPGVRVG
ncbi:MAG: mannose-phosphate guanylyltransferase [Thermoleophilaceae bacterium]|jgi:mannose-1-phosphate guanylyltransferase|nr:mannose-phosphate guanylyltransferase [Thermoleophilaceae bacterium]